LIVPPQDAAQVDETPYYSGQSPQFKHILSHEVMLGASMQLRVPKTAANLPYNHKSFVPLDFMTGCDHHQGGRSTHTQGTGMLEQGHLPDVQSFPNPIITRRRSPSV